MNKDVMFSSKKTAVGTPLPLFREWDNKYHFTLDVCATADNTKCKKFYSPEDNGLTKKWKGSCWMNPPYGRQITQWIKKAYKESSKNRCSVVALLPARTDTKYFHEYIYNTEHNVFKDGIEIRFLKGRIKFIGEKHAAPFPSMIVIFKNKYIK